MKSKIVNGLSNKTICKNNCLNYNTIVTPPLNEDKVFVFSSNEFGKNGEIKWNLEKISSSNIKITKSYQIQFLNPGLYKIEFQYRCLKLGINGIGIPDLAIAQNALQYSCEIYSLDKHFEFLISLTSL